MYIRSHKSKKILRRNISLSFERDSDSSRGCCSRLRNLDSSFMLQQLGCPMLRR